MNPFQNYFLSQPPPLANPYPVEGAPVVALEFHPYSKEQQVQSKPKPDVRYKGKEGYAIATERATDAQGLLHCEECGRPVPKGREERHHIVKRRKGGNEAENIRVVGKPCHEYLEAHGGKSRPKAEMKKLRGQCVS